MIEIENLIKFYGPNLAVDDISFGVKKGEILGFLGPNGAGKTTTMNILTGYLSATSGYARIGGHDILENPREAKKLIGYLPESPPLYHDMTVKEYLDFAADLKNVDKKSKNRHIAEIMQRVRIANVMNRLIKNLSKGYKQRVGLAQAMLGNPEVLILDEPTVGLDPKQIIEIRELIKSLGQNHTVILSSHILPEVSAVADRVIIIDKGKIAAEINVKDSQDSYLSINKVRILVEGPSKDILQKLRILPSVLSVEQVGDRRAGALTVDLESESGVDIRKAVFFEMARNSWPILEMKAMDASLEDVFLNVTSGTYYEQEVK